MTKPTERAIFSAEWVLACEYAFLDMAQRLCMIGVLRHISIPSLPVTARQIMIVVALKERPKASVNVDLNIAITLPSGKPASPSDKGAVDLMAYNDFIFVTLRGVPLVEEGAHQIAITISGVPLATLELPVFVQTPGRAN